MLTPPGRQEMRERAEAHSHKPCTHLRTPAPLHPCSPQQRASGIRVNRSGARVMGMHRDDGGLPPTSFVVVKVSAPAHSVSACTWSTAATTLGIQQEDVWQHEYREAAGSFRDGNRGLVPEII